MAGLLVSVRDAAEVEAALDGGAALIDVKEPRDGSLGRADADARESVLDAVAGRVPVSVALGELLDDDDPIDLSRIAYVKYGLAGCLRRPRPQDEWRALLTQARERVEGGSCRLVIAAYADWRRAESPSPQDVFRLAIRQQAAVALLDTWEKDGSTLLDWLPIAEIVRLCGLARSAGVRVALAGSLDVEQILALKAAAPDWFAVRGAACEGGGRRGAIDARRVRPLAEAAR